MIKKLSRNTHERMIFWALVAGIALSATLYSVAVHQTVMNVVKRAALEKNISTLSAQTTTLEAKYFSLSKSITSELAVSLGYKETSPTVIQRHTSLSMAH